MTNFTKNDLGATVVYSLMVNDKIHGNFATIDSADAYANEYLKSTDYIVQQYNVQCYDLKYKTIFNKLFNADRKYCNLVDLHQNELDLVEYGTAKYFNTEARQERSAHKAYENILKLWDKLPKAEKYVFNRQYEKLFGYECMAA